MLSNSCRYGIRAVIYLASQPLSISKTGIKKISKDLNLPTPFLAKILQQLAKKKILASTKGPNGGFSMLKDPKKISLLDIVNAIDGQDIFTTCIVHDTECSSADKEKKRCPLHDDYEKVGAGLMKLFTSKTIYDLVKKANREDMILI